MREQLERKVKFAITLIKSAAKKAEQHGQPLEICYSGGKDSDVILELAKMAGVNYRAIYKNTTIDPPGTIMHVREKGVEIIRPKKTFFQLLRKKGLPSDRVRFCCSVLKKYKILDYAVLGIRKEESPKRKKNYKEPEQCRVYSKTKEVRQYYPILEWSSDDIKEFINAYQIKCHPLYYDSKGSFVENRRLGCLACPLKTKKQRIDDFLKYPKLVRQYIKNASYYFCNSYKNKNRHGEKLFDDVFQWFTMMLFTDSMEEFRERFGKNLFDNGIDCKKFLEDYFHVNLDFNATLEKKCCLIHIIAIMITKHSLNYTVYR